MDTVETRDAGLRPRPRFTAPAGESPHPAGRL